MDKIIDNIRYLQSRDVILASIMPRAFTLTANKIMDSLTSSVVVVNPNNNKQKEVSAKWDTGSNVTLISSKLAEELELIQKDVVKTTFIGGEINVKIYLVNLELPNKIIAYNLEIYDWPNSANGIDILIGMDIIKQGDFTISNFEGKTKFGFRHPSSEHLDLDVFKSPFK